VAQRVASNPRAPTEFPDDLLVVLVAILCDIAVKWLYHKKMPSCPWGVSDRPWHLGRGLVDFKRCWRQRRFSTAGKNFSSDGGMGSAPVAPQII
jgi:hypothetical protein